MPETARYHRVVDIAEALLEATAEGIAAGGFVPPADRYVTVGDPVATGESMAVSVPEIVQTIGDSQTPETQYDRGSLIHHRTAEFRVWCFYPHPQFETAAGIVLDASAAEMRQVSVRVYGSILAGIDGVRAARKAGTIPTVSAVFEDAAIVGPEGGIVGVACRWRCSLAAPPT